MPNQAAACLESNLIASLKALRPHRKWPHRAWGHRAWGHRTCYRELEELGLYRSRKMRAYFLAGWIHYMPE